MINVFKIDLNRQCLLLMLVLGIFFYFTITRKPYALNQLNDVDSAAQLLLICCIFLKTFETSMKEPLLEVLTSFLIVIFNAGFLVWVIISIIKTQIRQIKTAWNSIISSIFIKITKNNYIQVLLELGKC